MRKILLFLLLSFCAMANAGKYRLYGTVYDHSDSRNPLDSVSVKVSVDGKLDTMVVTDSKGKFSVYVTDSCSVSFSDSEDGSCSWLDIVPGNVRKMTSKPYNLYYYDAVDKVYEFDDIYILAGKTPGYGVGNGFSVPVKRLTLDEIKGIDASNISDVLEQVLPGVEFSIGQNGTPVMNLQGMGGKDVLFLVDGEKMAGETMDNIDYDRLELNNVQRMDIHKGSSTLLYGSSAIGGVVDIVTRTPCSNKVTASANYRNHNDLRASGTAELVSKSKKLSSLTSLSFHNRDTYTLQGKDLTSTPVNVWGIRNLNANEKIRIQLGNNRDQNYLIARGGYYCETIDKQSYQGYNYFHQGVNAGIRGEFSLNKFWSLLASYYFDRYVKDYKYVDYDLPDKRKYENNNHNAKALLKFNKSYDRIEHSLQVGACAEYEYLLSDQFEFDLKPLIEAELNRLGITTSDYYYEIEGTPFKTHRQTTVNSFVSDVLNFKATNWSMALGLGVTSHSKYDTQLSPNVGVKKVMEEKGNKTTFSLTYGKGVRNPNLKERYMDYDVGGLGMFRIIGNSELTVEKSDNFSLSVNHDLLSKERFKGFFMVNGFYHNKRNCIEGQFNVRKDTMKYINVGEVQLYGFDASAKFIFIDKWTIDLNYTFLKDSYSNVTFTTNRPHSGTAKFSYNSRVSDRYEFFVSLNGTIKGKNESESVVYDSNSGEMTVDKTETYPAYSVWKLHSNHIIGKKRQIELSFGLDNILNYKPDRYDLVSCQSDGISVYGGVKFTF